MIDHPRARRRRRSAPPTTGSTRPSPTRRSTSTRACRARLGVPVIVKVETVNPIRSFKGRGTWVVVHALAGEGSDRPGPADRRARRPATSARASPTPPARSACPAVVFARRNANRGKVARMRALGATVIEVGEDFDDARGASEAYAAEHEAELLVDGDDARISTGAATLALEVTDARRRPATCPAPAVVAVPVGNGALINGVGSWLRPRRAGVPGRRASRPRRRPR